MLKLSYIGKSAAKYVFGTFALVAMTSMLYDSLLLTIIAIISLAGVTGYLVLRPTVVFPRNTSIITLSALILTGMNNAEIVGEVDRTVPWTIIGSVVFLGGLAFYLLLEARLYDKEKKDKQR